MNKLLHTHTHTQMLDIILFKNHNILPLIILYVLVSEKFSFFLLPHLRPQPLYFNWTGFANIFGKSRFIESDILVLPGSVKEI